MQSILQKHISSAISSTINLPSTATVEEIASIYKYAYEKELKGITIYRDGCKQSQPVTFTKTPEGDKKVIFNRPTKLTANVHTVETGNGKLYITVSAYNGKPVEVFMNMGKSGQTFNVFSEALGRTISIALQQGVSVDDLIATLSGINSDRVAWYRFEETDKKPTQILSIPDALAKLLQRYYTGKTETESTGTGSLCDKCGTYSVMKIEGCAVCQNCGESRCG
jgi:ribonucleoside-diphosphate reductase alpha chain